MYRFGHYDVWLGPLVMFPLWFFFLYATHKHICEFPCVRGTNKSTFEEELARSRLITLDLAP